MVILKVENGLEFQCFGKEDPAFIGSEENNGVRFNFYAIDVRIKALGMSITNSDSVYTEQLNHNMVLIRYKRPSDPKSIKDLDREYARTHRL
jgi:hypothetical protein